MDHPMSEAAKFAGVRTAEDPEGRSVVCPTLHLNGTSGPALFNQVNEAHAGVHAALELLMRARPHGRDYYPQGENGLARAAEQHAKWMAALREVEQGLYAVLEDVYDQNKARGR